MPAAGGGAVKEVKSKAEFHTIIGERAPAVLQFGASWCPESNDMEPVFSKLSTDFPLVRFLRVDIDEHFEISEAYSVSELPTFVFFKDGKAFDTLEAAALSSLANKVAELSGSITPGEPEALQELSEESVCRLSEESVCKLSEESVCRLSEESVCKLSEKSKIMASAGGGEVKEVKSKAELDNIIGEGAPAVLQFGASWCPESNEMDPVFLNLSTDFPLVRFLRVDFDEHFEISEAYSVSELPTFVFFKGGKIVDTLECVEPSILANKVAKLLESTTPGEPEALQELSKESKIMASAGGGVVKQIESKADLDTIIREGSLAVLLLAATWCPSSNRMETVFCNLSAEFPLVRFLRVDADEQHEISEKYSVSSVPYFVFFKDGKVHDTLEGAHTTLLANKVAKVSGAITPGDPEALQERSKESIMAEAGGAMKEVESKEELDTIVGEGAPAVLQFWSWWCPFSNYMDPVFSDLSTEFPLVRFLRVDNDEQLELVDEYSVSGVPTFVFFKDGKVVDTLDGALPSVLANKVAKISGSITPVEPASLGMAGGSCKLRRAPKESVIPPCGDSIENCLKQLMSSSPVVLFMEGTPKAPKCGFCSKVVNALEEEGVKFRSFDILTDEKVRQGLRTYWPNFPQLFYKGELIGGSDIVLELWNYGELKCTLSE